MNQNTTPNTKLCRLGRVLLAIGLAFSLTLQAAPVPPASTIEFAPQVNVTIGKSVLLKLPAAAARISVGNPAVADVILLKPTEVYLLGKTVGSTNIILWSKSGLSTVVDVAVAMDTASLQDTLQQLLPGEKNIKVTAAADTLVLSGMVADAVKAGRAVALTEAYAGKKVINMLQTAAPQQVMLEVKVAEVSKSLMDQLGLKFERGDLISNFLFGNLGGVITGTPGSLEIELEAQKKDGLVKILAEPTVMAMSGQEGSFLAGGKIFIPVPQTGIAGGVTLEEREFGVGLRFTPTVLEGGLINLRVAPEVSELSTTGTAFGSGDEGGSISILPTITTRRASTTVQLHDGQSFAISGLIKNNVTQSVKAFPVLGEIPILGALFRSSEFQNDRTELMFVVTPRLVKPLPPDYKLPTDSFIEPSRSEFLLEGRMEGKTAEPAAQPAATPAPVGAEPQTGPSGFEMK